MNTVYNNKVGAGYWTTLHYLSQSSPTHVCAFILAPAVRATTPDAIDVVGCATPVKNLGRDSWGLIGTTVTLPNQAWGDDLVTDKVIFELWWLVGTGSGITLSPINTFVHITRHL